VQFTTKCSQPSPYRLPLFIAFLSRGFKLLFTWKDLGGVVEGESEYVVQRFVASPRGKAAKVRVKWQFPHSFSFQRLCRKTSYPFNSSRQPASKPNSRTRRNSFTASDTPKRTEARTSQQLSFPMLLPSIHTPYSHRRALSTFSNLALAALIREDPYTVSIGTQLDSAEDRRPTPALEPFAVEVVTAFQTAKVLQGLTVSALSFDVMQGTDSRWYFLDVKEIRTESIEERVEQKLEALGWLQGGDRPDGRPLDRTLVKLRAFFQSSQSLIRHKTPFMPREERLSSFYY